MTADPELETAARRAYRDPNVVRWVLGYLSSLVGDQIWFVALSWAAVQVGGPAQVGLVLAAGAVPRSALLLFGGALADRWGIRRVAIASDLTRTALLIAAAVLTLIVRPGVGSLVVLSAAFGVVDALFLPAAAAMPQQLAARAELTRVQGLRAAAQRLATTIGAPLGGLMVAAAGVGGAWAVAAGGTAVSVGALARTRVRRRVHVPGEPIVRAVRGGLAYTMAHPVLRPLLIMATLTELGFGGAVNAGLPILSHSRGWGPSGVGVLLGAFGVGAAVSALAVVLTRRVPHVGRVFLPLVVVTAGALTGIGTTRSLPLAVVCAALVGLASGVNGVAYGSLILHESAPEMVARVASLSMLASLGLAPVALAMAGSVAAAYGASAPFVLGGIIVLAGAVPPLVARPLRRAELG